MLCDDVYVFVPDSSGNRILASCLGRVPVSESPFRPPSAEIGGLRSRGGLSPWHSAEVSSTEWQSDQLLQLACYDNKSSERMMRIDMYDVVTTDEPAANVLSCLWSSESTPFSLFWLEIGSLTRCIACSYYVMIHRRHIVERSARCC